MLTYRGTEEAISAWRTHAGHTVVRGTDRVQWYDRYELGIARVERDVRLAAVTVRSAL